MGLVGVPGSELVVVVVVCPAPLDWEPVEPDPVAPVEADPVVPVGPEPVVPVEPGSVTVSGTVPVCSELVRPVAARASSDSGPPMLTAVRPPPARAVAFFFRLCSRIYG